jgi:hypothetical protein
MDESEKIRKRPHIVHWQMSDENANVNTVCTEEWKNRLTNILRAYNDDELWNADEASLLFQALPDESLVVAKDQYKGGKRSDVLCAILLCST